MSQNYFNYERLNTLYSLFGRFLIKLLTVLKARSNLKLEFYDFSIFNI